MDIEEKSNFLPVVTENPKKNHKLTWRDTLPQILAGCMAFSILIQTGVNIGYSSVLLKGLKKTENPAMVITRVQGSWMVSLIGVAMPIGAISGGALMDRFGRKTLCIVTCIPIIISWIFVMMANSVEVIYGARIIAGLASGMATGSLVYVIEISHPKIRAMILTINTFAVSIGILLICLLEDYLNWREIAIFLAALNFIFFCMLFLIPESPYWLFCFNEKLDEKRIQVAKKNLKILNPRLIIYKEEYERIKETIEKKKEISTGNDIDSLSKKLINYFKMIRKPVVYKPIILLLAILSCKQLSGIFAIVHYRIGLDKYAGMVLLGVLKCVMTIIAACCSIKFGRRTLLIISGLGMAFIMFFCAMFIFYSKSLTEGSEKSIMPEHEWIVVVCVLLYMSMCSIGFTTLPWTLVGELLPISFRGIGSGLMISYSDIMMFAVIKTYPSVEHFGMQNVFLFFGFSALTGVTIVYFFLPETLGKSFAEIEKCFEKTKKNKLENTS